MKKRYVYSLSTRWLHPQAGSKATNIHFLLRHHSKVPSSWVIIWTARDDNLQNNDVLQTAIRRELMTIIDPQKLYAVRSSASVEDSGDFSCAGLFKSYLQVQGIDNIIEHVEKVWASLELSEFDVYLKSIMPRVRLSIWLLSYRKWCRHGFQGLFSIKIR